jgi:hypothetical protein
MGDESIIKLRALEKEFEITTLEYEESYQTYINSLSNASNSKELIVINGITYWGENALTGQPTANIETCKNMCIANSSCSGATFNSDKKYCWLRSGESNLSSGISSDSAIISEKMQVIEVLQHLNAKLITINDEITAILQQVMPIAKQDYVTQQQKQSELVKSSKLLKAERLLVLNMMNENNTYGGEARDNLLITNKINIELNFWMLFTLIIIIILVKTLLGKSVQFNRLFWIVIWLLLFVLTFNIKTPSGFLTWGILVLLIILMMLRIIPSP